MNNIILTILMIALSNGFVFAQTEPLDTDGNGYRNISTLDELRWVSENDSSWNWDFELDNDINAADTKNWNGTLGFSPIGIDFQTSFSGEFEGNGYRIDSLYINRPSQSNVALFGYINSAEISNVGMVNCDIKGENVVGGLVGANVSSIISKSYSTGSVLGGYYVGGLVGYNDVSRMRNSYSRASVEGDSYVGGLVGDHYQSSSLINSYSTGSVSGNEHVGGLVGHRNFSEMYYSFWNTQTSGQTTSSGGTGKSTAEMKTKSTFTDAGWDFENIWTIDGTTNDGYPYFRDEPTGILESETKVEKNVLIFPNPASEYIEISIPENHRVNPVVASSEIAIYDVLGNVVYSTKDTERSRSAEVGNSGSFSGYFDISTTLKHLYAQQSLRIDISHLPRGIYFVRIVNKVEKFVKR